MIFLFKWIVRISRIAIKLEEWLRGLWVFFFFLLAKCLRKSHLLVDTLFFHKSCRKKYRRHFLWPNQNGEIWACNRVPAGFISWFIIPVRNDIFSSFILTLVKIWILMSCDLFALSRTAHTIIQKTTDLRKPNILFRNIVFQLYLLTSFADCWNYF